MTYSHVTRRLLRTLGLASVNNFRLKGTEQTQEIMYTDNTSNNNYYLLHTSTFCMFHSIFTIIIEVRCFIVLMQMRKLRHKEEK